MFAIDIRNLTRDFGSRRAVDNLSLTVESGGVFALLGQNGAGKTTTIRMLSCLLAPTSGDALLMGESITSNPGAVKRRINVSPQETAVAPNLTVRENLEFMARVYGLNGQGARDKADELLAGFGLTDRAGDKAASLSGGMQRRLSIAMALVSDPDIVFLDEPTLGLDVRARRELWMLVEGLKGRLTVVLTTHYLEEAEALSDSIGVIHNGRLRAMGTADELKRATGKATLEDAFLALTDMEGF